MEGLTWQEVVYENGTQYNGYLDAGKKRQKQGIFKDCCEGVYVGDWEEGRMEGWGRYRWTDKTYEGELKAGEQHGKGKYTNHLAKTVYIGQYREGKIHGEGLLVGQNETLLQKWKNGKLLNSEKATVQQTLQYRILEKEIESQLHLTPVEVDTAKAWDCNITNKEQTLPSGCVFKGGFLGGKRYGEGEWSHPNGDAYKGQWFANHKHGWGQYTSPSNKRTYIGSWSHDKMDGYGVQYTTETRDCYHVGAFKADTKSGPFLHVTPDATAYEIWSDGKMTSSAEPTQQQASDFAHVKAALETLV
eukprot:TRINITY_DN5304_c0_g2_i1.p1 TRINITY_DN5304_c0_g2~~TRINITY_DN5304_c0_g2_i1.p1  ORF type:complete len:302 (+),score=66.26 TRINITY_DN5304_c0_g2_i1:57-962(+)